MDALNETILGKPLPGSWSEWDLPLGKWVWGMQKHPISPGTEGELTKEQLWNLSHGKGAIGPVRAVTGTGGH